MLFLQKHHSTPHIFYFYRPQTKFAKCGRGCGRGACVAGGCAWQGGMHGRGACTVGAVCGRGACVVLGVCMVGEGGMYGWEACMEGGGVWQRACVVLGVCMVGGMHGGEACMEGMDRHAWWGCAWQGGIHGGVGGICGMHAPQQILRDTVMWSMRGWYASYWNAFLLSYVFIVFSLFCITLLCTAFKSFRCIVTGPPGALTAPDHCYCSNQASLTCIKGRGRAGEFPVGEDQ